MSRNILYVGPDNVREISSTAWASVGITEPTRRWEKTNSYEQVVGDVAAAWLLANPAEFVDELGLTFPQAAGQFPADVATTPTGGTPDANTFVLTLQGNAMAKRPMRDFRGPLVSINSGVDGQVVTDDTDFRKFSTTVTADNGLVELQHQAKLSGTGAQVSQKASTEFLPGVADLETGTTTTGRAGIAAFQLPTLFSTSYRYRVSACVKIPTLSTGSETFEVRVGMCAHDNATPGSGFYFRLNNTDTNWRFCTNNAGSVTANDSGLAVVAGTYYTLDVLWDPALQAAVFYINGAPQLNNNIQTNIPAALSAWFYGASIYKSAGTTNRHLYVDWIAYEAQFVDRGRQLIR